MNAYSDFGLEAIKWVNRATNLALPDIEFEQGKVQDDGQPVVAMSGAKQWAEQHGWTILSSTLEDSRGRAWGLVSREGKVLTIAFRGTQFRSDALLYDAPIWDIVLNVQAILSQSSTFDPLRVPDVASVVEADPDNVYEAHSGFMAIYLALRSQLLQAVERVRRESVITKVRLYGHSLGAALAQYAYVDLMDRWPGSERPSFAVALLGSPNAFTRRSMPAVRTGDTAYAFATFGDMVPHVPSGGRSMEEFRVAIGIGPQNFATPVPMSSLGISVPLWGVQAARALDAAAASLDMPGDLLTNLRHLWFVRQHRINLHWLAFYRQAMLEAIAIERDDRPPTVITGVEVVIRTSDILGAGTDNDVAISFFDTTRVLTRNDPDHQFQRGETARIMFAVPEERGPWREELFSEHPLTVRLAAVGGLTADWHVWDICVKYRTRPGDRALADQVFELKDLQLGTADDGSNEILRSVWHEPWQRPLLVDGVELSLVASADLELDNPQRRRFDIKGNPSVAQPNTALCLYGSASAKRNQRFKLRFSPENNAYQILASQVLGTAEQLMSIHVHNRQWDGRLVVWRAGEADSASLEFWRFHPLGDGRYHITPALRSDLAITASGNDLALQPLKHGFHRQCWTVVYL